MVPKATVIFVKSILAFAMGIMFCLSWPTTMVAEVINYGTYKVDLPSGWAAATVGDDITVLTSPQGAGPKTYFLITSGLARELHEKATASLVKEKLQSTPKIDEKHVITIETLLVERVVVTLIGDHSDRRLVYDAITSTGGFDSMREWGRP